MCRCGIQEPPAISGCGFIHLSKSDRANQYTITFNEYKIGGGHHCRATQHIPHAISGLLSEKPSKYGTRLCVNVQCAPRSSSRSSVPRCRFIRAVSFGYNPAVFGAPRVSSPLLANTTTADGAPRLSTPGPGGTSSATTSPRSVTKTPSPERTRRTYSLKRFFNSRSPTVFIPRM
jgi:hypothetical protein